MCFDVFISNSLRITSRCLDISLTYAVFKEQSRILKIRSGDKGIRTLDPLLARQVLSQLSYTPKIDILISRQLTATIYSGCQSLIVRNITVAKVGLRGLGPPTSRLSGVRSNQLSYNPRDFGAHLSSHTVAGIVFSAACVLTIVFGMGTGVSHRRIGTKDL